MPVATPVASLASVQRLSDELPNITFAFASEVGYKVVAIPMLFRSASCVLQVLLMYCTVDGRLVSKEACFYRRCCCSLMHTAYLAAGLTGKARQQMQQQSWLHFHSRCHHLEHDRRLSSQKPLVCCMTCVRLCLAMPSGSTPWPQCESWPCNRDCRAARTRAVQHVCAYLHTSLLLCNSKQGLHLNR